MASKVKKKSTRKKPINHNTEPNQKSIKELITDYAKAIESTQSNDSVSSLKTFLLRDQIELVRQNKHISENDILKLVKLDMKFQDLVCEKSYLFDPSITFENFKKTYNPPKENWWWYFEEPTSKTTSTFIWQILISIIFVTTSLFSLDIIQRLWQSAPDSVSVLGTLLTTLITASPFTKPGIDFIKLLISKFPKNSIYRQTRTFFFAALFSLLVIIFFRFLVLPQLAKVYNNLGVDSLEAGNLDEAKHFFQRAIAIDNEISPSLYNLAGAYEKAGNLDEAILWYTKAINYDLNFLPVYPNLGRLLLITKDQDRAIKILEAGLNLTNNAEFEDQITLLTKYKLYTYLGQANYEVGNLELAKYYLEKATFMEGTNGFSTDLLSSIPHYYLALTFEEMNYSSNEILYQWELAFSYLTIEDSINVSITINDKVSEWRMRIKE